MDTSANTQLAAELASMRAIAEQGRDAPLVGGVFYMLWGGLMGVSSFIVFLAESEIIALWRYGHVTIWAAAGVIGWVMSMVIGARMGGRPGALTLGNQTARAVWFAVGALMTVLWIALMFAHDNFTALGVPRFFLFGMMFPIAFGVYGIAFYATAVAARQRWLYAFALLSWGFCVAGLFFLDSAVQFALGAAGSIACAFTPGLLMVLREPKTA